MVPRYQDLLSGAEEVESCLAGCLAEHLNAEVVLGTVSSTARALEWLRTTFLYVRVGGWLPDLAPSVCEWVGGGGGGRGSVLWSWEPRGTQ